MLSNNLGRFAEFVRNAPTDERAEQFVRAMLARVAASCPMDVLVQLAQCLIECRKGELQDEAGLN